MIARLLLAAAMLTVSPALGFEIDETIRSDRALIETVQRQLQELDYDPGGIDGLFGRRVQSAIEAFQTEQAQDLEAGLTREMVDRIGLTHRSWFRPPEMVRERLFQAPRRDVAVTITDLAPECAPENCRLHMFLLAARDLTGDGAPELVVSTIQFDPQWRDIDRPSPVVILANDGEGHFSLLQTPDNMPRRVHGREAAIADFNGDGVDDLFITGQGLDRPPFPGESVLLMLSGNGTLRDVTAANIPPLRAMNHGAVAHDIDGDGDVDVFVITNQGADEVDSYFLINDGTGHFTRSEEAERLTPSLRRFNTEKRDRSKSVTARFYDVNADGAKDLIFAILGADGDRAANYPGFRRARIVLNNGAQQWLRENAYELPVRRWGYWTHTTDADAADVDGDGDPDLLLTLAWDYQRLWRGQFHQLLLNDGAGNFMDATATHLWAQGYEHMENINFAPNSFLVDLDSDGDPDLVTHSIEPLWGDGRDSIRLALNDGTGHFAAVDPHSLSSEPHHGRQLHPADVDGDGDVDLVGLTLTGDMVDNDFRTIGFAIEVFENWTILDGTSG